MRNSQIIVALYFTSPVVAATDPEPMIPYATSVDDFQASLQLPLRGEEKHLKISDKILKVRTQASSDERVEQLNLSVPAQPDEMREMVERLAKPNKSGALLDAISVASQSLPAQSDGTKKIRITKKMLPWMDSQKLNAHFPQKSHQELTLMSKDLDSEGGRVLLSQLKDYFTTDELDEFMKKLKIGAEISIDRQMLPKFARKMIGKFTPYRGPNCFHAALAFQSEQLPRSMFINVKKEPGYHRAMINYDELWRAIQANFYEIDPQKSALKYGDMLVFFELPKDASDQRPYFKWIRHAATYLFGSYTFSKGSKSADSPYSIKTLAEEWRTWRGYTKNLGLKVFRRASKDARTVPPHESLDWIY